MLACLTISDWNSFIYLGFDSYWLVLSSVFLSWAEIPWRTWRVWQCHGLRADRCYCQSEQCSKMFPSIFSMNSDEFYDLYFWSDYDASIAHGLKQFKVRSRSLAMFGIFHCSRTTKTLDPSEKKWQRSEEYRPDKEQSWDDESWHFSQFFPNSVS